VELFMDIQSLTPQPGRLKCIWVPGADGRPESIWVPDWESDAEVTPLRKVEPVRKLSRKAG
jgi:hypothetical protein